MSKLARRHRAYWKISAPRARKLRKRGVFVWFTVSASYTGWIRHNPLTLCAQDDEDDGIRMCCRCGKTIDLNDYIDPQDFGPPDEDVYCGANEWCTP